MKKLYTFLTVALATAFAAGAVTPPYSSNIGDKSTSNIAADWTITDFNKDKTTWVYDSADDKLTSVTGANCGVKYGYNNSNDADDWLYLRDLSLQQALNTSSLFGRKIPKFQIQIKVMKR